MKAIILLIGTLLGMSILSSCSDDDEIPVPKDDSWYWGYFRGTINGKQISVVNEPHKWFVQNVKTSASPPDNDTDSIRGMIIGIQLNDNESLGITLYHLHQGVRYVTKSTKIDWIYDGIQMSRNTHSDINEERYIHYIPKQENPFRVEITTCTYVDQWHPIVEATLDGILYRIDNPMDSVIIKGSYGTR